MNGMRIGIDATCWANERGYGRFTRELLRSMASLATQHTLICFLDERAAARFDLHGPNVSTIVVPQSAPPTLAAAADGHRALTDMLQLTRAVRCAKPDVFFFPSVYTYFPLPPGVRAVVTVHDAIADRYPHLTLPSLRARVMWRCKVRLALWQARIVLTVSDFAASEIEAVLHVPRERIRVSLEAPAAVYEPSRSPADVAQMARRVGVPEGARWFVYVGGFNPHKNVDAIVRAHAAIARTLGPGAPHLILVGAATGDVFHGDHARIRRAIADGGTDALVHWPGFVVDEDLRHLHSGAVALLLPSTCEGFGLPAVEAAACGTPVIATTDSPLPQLLEGGGIFVKPGDEASLQRAMQLMIDDERARTAMGQRARERTLLLTWAHAARVALDALHEAAA